MVRVPPASFVFHSSTKLLPLWVLTVTFSFAGVALYAVPVH